MGSSCCAQHRFCSPHPMERYKTSAGDTWATVMALEEDARVFGMTSNSPDDKGDIVVRVLCL